MISVWTIAFQMEEKVVPGIAGAVAEYMAAKSANKAETEVKTDIVNEPETKAKP